jgi:hypothetical protein
MHFFVHEATTWRIYINLIKRIFTIELLRAYEGLINHHLYIANIGNGFHSYCMSAWLFTHKDCL